MSPGANRYRGTEATSARTRNSGAEPARPAAAGELAPVRDFVLTLGRTISLAAEIAHEQRNGRGRVGAALLVGNPEEVLARCRPLALDPLRGHPARLKLLEDPGARETLKQLARLGHAFVVSDEGVALSVVRLPGVPSRDAEGSRGNREEAAASISGLTGAVAVVVSEDSAVRVFERGRLVCEISRQKEPAPVLREQTFS